MYFLTYKRHSVSFLESYFLDIEVLEQNYDDAQLYLLEKCKEPNNLEEYKDYVVALLDVAAYRFDLDYSDQSVLELLNIAKEKLQLAEASYGVGCAKKLKAIVNINFAIYYSENCKQEDFEKQLGKLAKYFEDLEKGEHDSFYYEYKYMLISLFINYSYLYDEGFDVIKNTLSLVNECLPYLKYMDEVSYAKACVKAYLNIAFMSDSDEQDFYLSFYGMMQVFKIYRDVLLIKGDEYDVKDLLAYAIDFIEECNRVKAYQPARYVAYEIMDFSEKLDRTDGFYNTPLYALMEPTDIAIEKARDDVSDLDVIKIYNAIGLAKSHLFYEDNIEVGLDEINKVLPLAEHINKTCKGHKMKLILAYTLMAKSELLGYQNKIEEQQDCLYQAYEILNHYATAHNDDELWLSNVAMIADFAHDLKFIDQDKAEDVYCAVIGQLKNLKESIYMTQAEMLCEVFNDFIHMEVNMANNSLAEIIINDFLETTKDIKDQSNTILFHIALAHFYLSEIKESDKEKEYDLMDKYAAQIKTNPDKAYLGDELIALAKYGRALDMEDVSKQTKQLNKALDLLHSIMNEVDASNIELYLNFNDLIQSTLEFDETGLEEA